MPNPRPRLFVLTDISSEEPDDLQSLIRLLLYGNEIEIEGLVATLSEWKSILGSPFRPDLIHRALDAYALVRDQLCRHAPGYPEADALRQTVAVGNGNDLAATGHGKNSPGAEQLAEAILRDDPRPLWVTIWGGAATLAQTIRMLDEKLDPATFAERLDRVWIYEIQGQDDCGAWLANTYPNLNYIRSQYQWRGMSNRVDGVWPEPRRYLDDYVAPRWFNRHIREGHGPLGELYPHARFMFEGDTPSFLHLIPNGLHEPTQIDQGGWGGRFLAQKTLKVWSGGCPVNDEARFGRFAMHTDAADRLFVEGNGKQAWNVYNPQRRWRDAYQNDFAARMDWCVRDPEAANHAPIVVVDGDGSGRVLKRRIAPGGELWLDASASADPAGRPLRYEWWLYEEAGHGHGLQLEADDTPTAILRADPDATGRHHLILELTNEGEPPLKAYRRILVETEGTGSHIG